MWANLEGLASYFEIYQKIRTFVIETMLNWASHITSNPNVVFGKPTIINTRISVDLILEKLANGDSVDDLISAYPNITKDNITACLLFAAHSIKNEIVYSKAS